jgi:CubicO group peptidase (beta-lactamase class C family)
MKNVLLCLSLAMLLQPLYGQRKKRIRNPEEEFNQYVHQALQDWEVPGAALVVVKDGKVVYKQAFGIRTLGQPEPVDTQTLFACASTTKAMTATCMGMLVDEGKLQWDDPVSTYLPNFQLYDPYVTRHLRIRDLLTHSSGVGNTDYLWGGQSLTSEEVLRRMRYVEPSYPFRGGYTYQNIFYLAAGKVIEQVSGIPWEQFIQERIFDPLGMRRTYALLSKVPDANRATPHLKVKGVLRAIPPLSADAIGPAGSVQSCIDDLALWTLAMLDSSKYEGGRLVTPATWEELFAPQVIIPRAQFYPTALQTHPHWTSYGLGWFQHDYRGQKVNFHTGSLPGEIAIHGQLPVHRLGIFFVGNLDHAEVRHALLYRAFDQFALGLDRDWNQEFRELFQRLDEDYIRTTAAIANGRVSGTPAAPIEELLGTYSSPLFGKVLLTQKERTLRILVNDTEAGTLEHWHYDTYRVRWDKEEDIEGITLYTFGRNPVGRISELKTPRMIFQKSY